MNNYLSGPCPNLGYADRAQIGPVTLRIFHVSWIKTWMGVCLSSDEKRPLSGQNHNSEPYSESFLLSTHNKNTTHHMINMIDNNNFNTFSLKNINASKDTTHGHLKI